jgi:lysophospholipase L1-like esterase
MMSPVTQPRQMLRAVLSAALALAIAAPASARPVPAKPPVEVKIGRAATGTSATGLPSLLVPVRYPIQLAGRLVEIRVALLDASGNTLANQVLHERLSSGRVRRPERRRGFTFVHRVGIDPEPALITGKLAAVQVVARGKLDLDEDGKAELRSVDRSTRAPSLGPREQVLCSSLPHLRVRRSGRVSVPLPACTPPKRWGVARQPDHGSARLREGVLTYRPAPRFRGADSLVLSGGQEVRFTVGAPAGAVVRALGDSVTAGFGYYDDGSSMTIGHLLECRPAANEFDDACSSNSLNRTSKGTKVEYALDYGLANNVSWAAQWANEHGLTNYENYAVSGSEPADWAPGGEFHATTAQIEAEDPDYILMTMGANPLLSEMLFGLDDMGCAIASRIFGDYRECIEGAFAEVHLRANLKALYTDLVKNTDATIFLMQYHLSVPSTALAYSATQIAEMGKLLNREIEAVAAEVNPERLQVVTPPHFDVGIDISPVYPSRFSCSRLGFEVDGPSVQSTPTQGELELLHPLSFCDGPAGGGAPWVISGDTGIHPSAAGYAQMASQVPPPS